MAKGLSGVGEFTALLTADQRRLAERLAEIEREDADRCAGCGGEDCCCCEYYLDRQRWQSPEELFADDHGRRSRMVKYYSTQRPVSPGTFPREGAGRIVNFDNKQFCEEIGRDAWGYIEYAEPLSAAQMEAYELTRGGMKKFWCVTTSVNDRGRVAANITNVIEAVPGGG